jgi:hypothetical protein
MMEPQIALSGQEELLREGLENYLRAASALKEFQRVVQRKCREAVEAEKTLLATTFGTAPRLFTNYLDSGNRNYAAMGVKGTVGNATGFCVALWWEMNELYSAVWTSHRERAKAQIVLDRLSQNNPDNAGISGNSAEVWLRLQVPPAQVVSDYSTRLGEDLRAVIRHWCQAWSHVPGGIRHLID